MDNKDFCETEQELLTLPVLAVRGTVAFPVVTLGLDIVRPVSLKAMAMAGKHDGRILLLTQKDPSQEDPKEHDFF